jgi:hypothetical protein
LDSFSRAVTYSSPQKVIDERKTFKTNCRWCDAKVFYHTNGNGDSVYFDSLGAPWEVHKCWLEYWEEEKTKQKFAEYKNRVSLRYSILEGALKQMQSSSNSINEESLAKFLGLTIIHLRNSYAGLYSISENSLSIDNAKKNLDICSKIRLTLKEAFKGCEKEISVRRQLSCPECYGVGRLFSGLINEDASKVCHNCEGEGLIQEKIKLKIQVPARLPHNSRLRVAEYGHEDNQTNSFGDLYLNTNILKSSSFSVRGIDIFSSIEVDIFALWKGDEKKIFVDTLEGQVGFDVLFPKLLWDRSKAKIITLIPGPRVKARATGNIDRFGKWQETQKEIRISFFIESQEIVLLDFGYPNSQPSEKRGKHYCVIKFTGWYEMRRTIQKGGVK